MPQLSAKRSIASLALITAGLGILAAIWWKIVYVMAFLIFSPSDWKGFAAVALILLPGFLIAGGIASLTKRFDSESIFGWSVLGSIFGAFVLLVAGWNHIPFK